MSFPSQTFEICGQMCIIFVGSSDLFRATLRFPRKWNYWLVDKTISEVFHGNGVTCASVIKSRAIKVCVLATSTSCAHLGWFGEDRFSLFFFSQTTQNRRGWTHSFVNARLDIYNTLCHAPRSLQTLNFSLSMMQCFLDAFSRNIEYAFLSSSLILPVAFPLSITISANASSRLVLTLVVRVKTQWLSVQILLKGFVGQEQEIHTPWRILKILKLIA